MIHKTGAEFAPLIPKVADSLKLHLSTFTGTKRQTLDITILALQVAMLNYVVRTDAPSDRVDEVLDDWQRDVYAIRDALGLPAG